MSGRTFVGQFDGKCDQRQSNCPSGQFSCQAVSPADLLSGLTGTGGSHEIPQSDRGHHPAYRQVWQALYADEASEPKTLLQFGTLARHLADIDPQQAICDHTPADYRPSTHTQVTWDLNGRRVALRRQ